MYLRFRGLSSPTSRRVGRAISWREGRPALDHRPSRCCVIVILLVSANCFRSTANAAPQRRGAAPAPRRRAPTRFVFVQPRVDSTAPKPPAAGRAVRSGSPGATPERRRSPTNPLPFSRGNTPERVEATSRPQAAAARSRTRSRPRAAGTPDAAPAENDAAAARVAIGAAAAAPTAAAQTAPTAGAPPGGVAGRRAAQLAALRAADQFDNPQGGGAVRPAIQFDTKGVEFGPWIRRFIAQVKRNWRDSVRRHVDEGARRRHVQRAQGRHASPI